MGNITLSIPDEVIKFTRGFAKKNGTSLNAIVRDYLEKFMQSSDSEEIIDFDALEKLASIKLKDNMPIRDEIYKR